MEYTFTGGGGVDTLVGPDLVNALDDHRRRQRRPERRLRLHRRRAPRRRPARRHVRRQGRRLGQRHHRRRRRRARRHRPLGARWRPCPSTCRPRAITRRDRHHRRRSTTSRPPRLHVGAADKIVGKAAGSTFLVTGVNAGFADDAFAFDVLREPDRRRRRPTCSSVAAGGFDQRDDQRRPRHRHACSGRTRTTTWTRDRAERRDRSTTTDFTGFERARRWARQRPVPDRRPAARSPPSTAVPSTRGPEHRHRSISRRSRVGRHGEPPEPARRPASPPSPASTSSPASATPATPRSARWPCSTRRCGRVVAERRHVDGIALRRLREPHRVRTRRNDAFVFSGGGRITGTIAGGAGGIDGFAVLVQVAPHRCSAPSTRRRRRRGSTTFQGTLVTYTGMDAYTPVGGTAADRVITGSIFDRSFLVEDAPTLGQLGRAFAGSRDHHDGSTFVSTLHVRPADLDADGHQRHRAPTRRPWRTSRPPSTAP